MTQQLTNQRGGVCESYLETKIKFNFLSVFYIMTTYRNPLTHGSGLFLDHKYPGENHMHGYSYLGPGTRLDIRLDENMKPRAGEEVKDALDATALRHDIAYQTIQDQYKRDKDKPKALAAVRKADDEFITQARNSGVQPLGKISAGLIKMKELGESTGVLSTKTFSGLGVKFHTKDGKEVSFTKKHDPTARLKNWLISLTLNQLRNKKGDLTQF